MTWCGESWTSCPLTAATGWCSSIPTTRRRGRRSTCSTSPPPRPTAARRTGRPDQQQPSWGSCGQDGGDTVPRTSPTTRHSPSPMTRTARSVRCPGCSLTTRGAAASSPGSGPGSVRCERARWVSSGERGTRCPAAPGWRSPRRCWPSCARSWGTRCRPAFSDCRVRLSGSSRSWMVASCWRGCRRTTLVWTHRAAGRLDAHHRPHPRRGGTSQAT